MRKTSTVVLTILAFITSFYLANHFAENKLVIPTQISQSIRWFESLFLSQQANDVDTIPDQLVNTNQASIGHGSTEQQYSHVEVGRRSTCIDTSKGELKYKKVGDIYSWTDEEGVYHVSDKAPDVGQYDIYNYAGE